MKETKDFIPFHKPFQDESEVNEVIDTIRSGWWTTGPKTKKFENEFKSYLGCSNSLAVSSWTAAAHLALEAIGLKPGDEVIVPAMTFTSTAEIVCYFGAVPVIVDVQRDTFNIDPVQVEKAITNKTKAIIPVHFGGQPCDLDELTDLAASNNIKIVEDAAHALPAVYKGRKIGTISDVTCFSFYATKTLATGEGGMICTEDEGIAKRCSIMRLHGINSDAWKRYTSEGSWYYEVIAPGYKYNFTDIQAGLGLAQLKKIELLHRLRKEISEKYDSGFETNALIRTHKIRKDRNSAYHLYPIEIEIAKMTIDRARFVNELKDSGVGASVHFIPLYRHPFYRDTFKLKADNYPNSESIYSRIISLPIWPGMSDYQIEKVIGVVNGLTTKFAR
jgi:perosamine synthetase